MAAVLRAREAPCGAQVDPKVVARWAAGGVRDKELAIIRPNPFIPQNFTMLPPPPADSVPPALVPPRTVVDKAGARLWYKQVCPMPVQGARLSRPAPPHALALPIPGSRAWVGGVQPAGGGMDGPRVHGEAPFKGGRGMRVQKARECV